jgi:hypothetical protein
MMKGQARRSGLVMGFDTHMIAGAVPALRPARPTQPNITNRSNPHYDETLALQGARASKGVFITTSRFTEDAADYVTRVQPRVVLIDGRRLADLMIEYGVGVRRVRSYELKRVDEDYFVDEEGSGPAPSGVASDALSDAP